MPTFETLLKLITEKWDLLLAVIVLIGGTGLVGGLLQWRAKQQQRRRQRQIPAGDFPFEVIPPNSPDVVQPTKTLDLTWHQRYKTVVRQYPVAKSIYTEIAVLQSLNLTTQPGTTGLVVMRCGARWMQRSIACNGQLS